jgi:hypothetical protein
MQKIFIVLCAALSFGLLPAYGSAGVGAGRVRTEIDFRSLDSLDKIQRHFEDQGINGFPGTSEEIFNFIVTLGHKIGRPIFNDYGEEIVIKNRKESVSLYINHLIKKIMEDNRISYEEKQEFFNKLYYFIGTTYAYGTKYLSASELSYIIQNFSSVSYADEIVKSQHTQLQDRAKSTSTTLLETIESAAKEEERIEKEKAAKKREQEERERDFFLKGLLSDDMKSISDKITTGLFLQRLGNHTIYVNETYFSELYSGFTGTAPRSENVLFFVSELLKLHRKTIEHSIVDQIVMRDFHFFEKQRSPITYPKALRAAELLAKAGADEGRIKPMAYKYLSGDSQYGLREEKANDYEFNVILQTLKKIVAPSYNHDLGFNLKEISFTQSNNLFSEATGDDRSITHKKCINSLARLLYAFGYNDFDQDDIETPAIFLGSLKNGVGEIISRLEKSHMEIDRETADILTNLSKQYSILRREDINVRAFLTSLDSNSLNNLR